jgi:ketosteroid isomerase-like protein
MATTTTKTEQELLGLEKQFWQAIKDRDFDSAVRLTDESCIVTGAQGAARIEKDAFRDMMESATYTLHDFKMSDPHVRLLGDDIAVLAYKVHEDLTVEGKPVTIDAAEASTWVRRPQGWVCALHTESILGDPFGRDRREMT